MKQNKGGRKRLQCFPFLYLKELEAEQRKETSGAQQSEEEVASNWFNWTEGYNQKHFTNVHTLYSQESMNKCWLTETKYRIVYSVYAINLATCVVGFVTLCGHNQE